MVSVLVIELDAANPVERLGDWLSEAGAEITTLRPHAGDAIPADAPSHNAVICLGGRHGVYDDDTAPYLADMRVLMDKLVTAAVPTLAIGLGAQLLAVASGGRVEPRPDGWSLGALLAAKRDATEQDPLLGLVPITPDVMEFHRETITLLPGGSQLLISSPRDAVEAFRIGSSAWGLQFHIETSAETLRSWLADPERGIDEAARERAERAFGSALDEAEEIIGEVWPGIIRRFVQLVEEGIPQTPTGHAAPRLPLVGQ